MKFKFYDTCSLLEQAGNLFSSDDFTLVISSITLKELEHIKSSHNKDADVKFAARKVLADLEAHYGQFKIVMFDEKYVGPLLSAGLPYNEDLKIIACAVAFADEHMEDEVIFVTNDLLCRHIASIYFKVE